MHGCSTVGPEGVDWRRGLTNHNYTVNKAEKKRPHRLRVESVGDAAEVTDALEASNVVSLRVVA